MPSASRIICSTFVALGLLSCSHVQVAEPTGINDQLQPKIISLQKDFKIFWERAKGQPLARQLELWDEFIEAPRQAFYDDVVWEKRYDTDWKRRKREQLSRILPTYAGLAPTIDNNFANFPKVVTSQLGRFAQFFPYPKLYVPVYAVLSPNFNGRGATLGGNGRPEEVILAFGIDTISGRKDSVDILYPHELFHIYHFKVAGISQEVQMRSGRLTLPLWEEGLATYVSGVVSPGHTDGDLLMDSELGRVPSTRIPDLARRFLIQANEKAFDENKPEIYKSWFNIGKYKVAPDLPNRCGYLLGLYVARTLAKSHSLDEMTHWNLDAIHAQVMAALQIIAKNQ